MVLDPMGFLTVTVGLTINGLSKVNLEWPFLGLKFENLENETSVCVRNWELKLGSDFLQNPYFDNQQLLRNKSKLKLKYEVNPI